MASRFLSAAARFFRTTKSLALIGASAVVGGTALYFSVDRYKKGFPVRLHSPILAAERANDSPEETRRSRRFNFIAEAADIAGPAVVFVEVYGRHPWAERYIQVASGSGFIVSGDGTVITNAHVIANSREVKVKLSNGNSYNARVQEMDQVADLAVLKIEPKERLAVAKLGSSSMLRAGEWVVAIGSPLSLSNSVTAGVVSTVGRASKELGLRYKDIDYIQTDATITVGNSGGPLVNLDGEVIGINTMTTVPGISFAIPVDRVKQFLQDVEMNRKHRSSLDQKYIGISMISLRPALVESLQFRVPNFPNIQSGVYVAKVASNSPADRGGLYVGDVIVEINGQPVKCTSDIYRFVQQGQLLQIRVHRGQQQVVVNVTPDTMRFGR